MKILRTSGSRWPRDEPRLHSERVSAVLCKKYAPIRNKIDLTSPIERRAWTKRLGVAAEELRAAVEKVGDAVSAVTKEIELQRKESNKSARDEPLEA